MPPRHGEGNDLPGVEIHALLGSRDGGGGLHRRPESQGHAIGDAAQDAAAVIALSNDSPVFYGKGIIILAAPEPGRGEAGAELDALHRRDAEDGGGDPVLHPIEHGVAQPGRQAQDGALNDAAERIPLRPGRRDGGAHGLPR